MRVYRVLLTALGLISSLHRAVYRTDDPSDSVYSGNDIEASTVAATSKTAPASSLRPSPSHIPRSPNDTFPSAAQVTERAILDSTGSVGSSQPLPPCRPTKIAHKNCEALNDAALGAIDCDLSEISESPVSEAKGLRRSSISLSSVPGRISFEPSAPANTSSKSAARLVRGGLGNVVLDSDDDAPPTSPRRRRITRKALLYRSTTDGAGTQDREGRSVSPAVSVVAPVSLVVSSPPALGCRKPQQDCPTATSATGPKVLRFLDLEIPAPDFHAPLSSPPFVPSSSLKSALVKKVYDARTATRATLASPGLTDIADMLKPADKRRALKASKVLDDLGTSRAYALFSRVLIPSLAPPLSSPTPVSRKPIKTSLRRKVGPIDSEPDATSARVYKLAKRKLSEKEDIDYDELSSTRLPLKEPPAKRARITAAGAPTDDTDSNPLASCDSKLLRPTSRLRRKYHAKGRTSSPTASVSEFRPSDKWIDYDELPSPPRPSAAGTVSRSSPLAVASKKAFKRENATRTGHDTNMESQIKDTKKEAAARKTKLADVKKDVKASLMSDTKIGSPRKVSKAKKPAALAKTAGQDVKTRQDKKSKGGTNPLKNGTIQRKSRAPASPRKARRAIHDEVITKAETNAPSTDHPRSVTVELEEYVIRHQDKTDASVIDVDAGGDASMDVVDGIDDGLAFNDSTDFTVRGY